MFALLKDVDVGVVDVDVDVGVIKDYRKTFEDILHSSR